MVLGRLGVASEDGVESVWVDGVRKCLLHERDLFKIPPSISNVSLALQRRTHISEQ